MGAQEKLDKVLARQGDLAALIETTRAACETAVEACKAAEQARAEITDLRREISAFTRELQGQGGVPARLVSRAGQVHQERRAWAASVTGRGIARPLRCCLPRGDRGVGVSIPRGGGEESSMSQDDDTTQRGELVRVGDIPLDVPGVGRTLTAKRQAPPLHQA